MNAGAANTVGDTIPELQPGLYTLIDGLPRLVGNRCRACDRMHFPRHAWCAKCCSGDMEDVALAERGRIGSFSWVDRQPADAFIRAPYMQAEVEYPEGVSAFSVIEALPGELKTGMAAEVVLRTYDTPQGPRQAFVFRPAPTKGYRP
jgi:uncharacterized OB-fold protein